jgi:short-subunit dehydrogenase
MKKIVIIGASAGIGKALAELYIKKGYEIAITGRRTALLDEIKQANPEAKIHVYSMDVANIDASLKTLEQIFADMGKTDVVIMNAGVGVPKADLAAQLYTVDINARGFMAIADASYKYFKQEGKGQFVGVSSIASLIGGVHAPEYNASKAFISNYMQGLRLRSIKWKHGVNIIDIRPGFVDTDMTKSNKNMFWVATPEKAAKQIYNAIVGNKKVAYITRRYWFLVQLLKVLPESILAKMM